MNTIVKMYGTQNSRSTITKAILKNRGGILKNRGGILKNRRRIEAGGEKIGHIGEN
jgi:hypothetical protein